MNVIFLDFDGVILTKASRFRHPDRGCVALLDTLCRDTEASVVISSTWRGIGLGRCRAMLREAGFTAPVIGITPTIWETWKQGRRGDEIGLWLLNQGSKVDRFCILDDDDDMGDLLPYLVRTQTLLGLTEADVAAARLLLAADLSSRVA